MSEAGVLSLNPNMNIVPLPVPGGGTGRTTLVPAHGVVIAEGVAPVNVSNAGTDGQLLIAATNADPAFASLVAGAGVSLTPGANSLTIAMVGVAVTWNLISASQALISNNGYFCVSPGGALSLSLPATSNKGDEIEITLDGATSWTLTQPNAGSRIRIGNQQTSLGVGGTLASTAQGDSIRLVCQTANNLWNVISMIGNITIV